LSVPGVRQIELKLKYPCTVLHQLSYLMESKVGGTSGAIYGIFFAAMAKAFEVMDDMIYHYLLILKKKLYSHY
jgi:hypothetical protein